MTRKKSPYGDNIKDFKIGDKIGCGGFGEVFKARCLSEGFKRQDVAIKRISKKLIKERKCMDKIKNEIHIHSTLPPHPAFVKFLTSFEDDNYLYLVLELCEGGSLEEYIKNRSHLSEEEAVKLIKQVIYGVRCLHANLIIHRDLSLRNLLLTSAIDDQQVKIADFGLAATLKYPDDKKNTVVGTAHFMSPEVANNDDYDFNYDYWSVGCVLYALLYGSLPFIGKTRKEIMENVKHSTLKFPRYASKEAKKLLKAMLNKREDERIGLQDALTYDLFQKYEKSGKINEINYQKISGDSGMSSLSGSGSKKSQSAHKSSAEYDYRSIHYKSQKGNKCVKNAPVATRYDQVISQKQRSEHALYENRYESQYDTPIKKRPECPSYPSELRYLANRNLNSQICCSVSDSINCKSHSVKPSNSSTQCSMYRQNSCVKHYAESPAKDLLCSHDQYCAPGANCFHKQSCCCHQNRNNSCPSEKFTTESENCVNLRSTIIEKSLKDIGDPLNTARLSCRRIENEKKKIIFHILNDGQVYFEYLKIADEKKQKRKKGKKIDHFIYFISANGLEISVYKSKKEVLLNLDEPPPNLQNEHEVQYFSFENLPDKYRDKYKLVKLFVDTVRGQTPKITIHGDHASFIMMENTPNPTYEMNFYNGFQIIEKENKKTIKNRGCNVTINDDDFMLKEFTNMKCRCIRLEKLLEASPDAKFPVTFGKKPDASKRIVMQDNNKENISATSVQSPSFNGLNSAVRHCNISIVPENSFIRNTFQSPSATYSSKMNLSTSPSKSIDNILPYLKSLKMENVWVIAEYKDCSQLWISMENDMMFFKDAKTQKFISNTQDPDLKPFLKDSRDILRCALLKERKT